MNKLVLAEKPSADRSIATVLNTNERGDGFLMGNGYIGSYDLKELIVTGDD